MEEVNKKGREVNSEKQLTFILKVESSDWHMQVRWRGTLEANTAHTLLRDLGLNSRPMTEGGGGRGILLGSQSRIPLEHG